jgi:(2S)-methylsuccinyl-CoA dehydrogenase
MNPLSNTVAALDAAEALLAKARANLASRVTRDGAVEAGLLDSEQLAAHALAWMATYVAALRQLRGWASRLDAAGELGEAQRLILAVGFGEYAAQLAGGIAMGQGEIARPQDLGLDDDDLAALRRSPLVASARFSPTAYRREARGWATRPSN